MGLVRCAFMVSLLSLFFVTCGSDSGGGNKQGSGDVVVVDGYEFHTYRGTARDPDVLTERLCQYWDDPDGAPDKVFITCRMEGGNFSSLSGFKDPEGPLKIVAYNIERGRHLDEQLGLFTEDPDLKRPDILLVSEADRGCSRSGNRNVIREYARELGMNYVYGVEFVELPRSSKNPDLNIEAACEHGNGIISRYPIGNVRVIRYAKNKSWYDSPTQPRLGGRIAVVADVLIGGRILHLYSVHFESGLGDDPYRKAQAQELVADAADKPFPVIIGGDMNTIFYVVDLIFHTHRFDPTTKVFLSASYQDAHEGLTWQERATTEDNILGIYGVIDLFFVKGLAAPILDRGVCPEERCGGLSDHMPIWFSLDI